MRQKYSNQSYPSPSTQLASFLLQRLRGAARKERWGKAFLQVAWTAGPVTYLGLQSGYYIAYGSAAPNASFIYFAGYTLVAGMFALVARFLYNATRGESKSSDHAALEFVFDALPQRVVEIRNLQLEALDHWGKRVLSAKYLLENPLAGADAMAAAVWDVLEDIEIAEGIRRMETYRSNGLHVRAREIAEQLKAMLAVHEPMLRTLSEPLAETLQRQLAEERSNPLIGRTRTRGFLNRCYAAADNDDINRMTLADAEEVCILIFEIINRRSFPRYTVDFRGRPRYTEAARQLHRARSEYRAAIYRRNDSIRVLAEELYLPLPEAGRGQRGGAFPVRKKRGPGIHRVIASIPEIRSARILQERIVEALKAEVQGKNRDTAKSRHLLQLYRRLFRQAEAALAAHGKYRKAWENMEAVLQAREDEGRDTIRLVTGAIPGRKAGIRLNPAKICLDDRRILPFARKIYDKLGEFDDLHENQEIQTNDQKELAIDLLLIADEFLPLEEAAVQRAIERTSSAYITRSNPGQRGSQQQRLWSLAPVRPTAFPGSTAVHELLENLVSMEGLRLVPEDIDFCVEQYGADRSVLEALMERQGVEGAKSFSVPEPYRVPAAETFKGLS